MKSILLFALFFLIVVVTCSSFITASVSQQRSFPKSPKSSFNFPNLVNLVDTRIGTGGFGFGSGELNPGPTAPFGNMRLGPDTSLGLEPFNLRIENYGGYNYMDDYMLGQSHTHVCGAGAGDWQNFLVTAIRLPSGVTTTSFPSTDLIQNAGYKSKFSHDTETAKPGYYSVLLETPNVQTELTVAGTHSGIHRYTFLPVTTTPSTVPAILFDICHAASQNFFGPFESACKSAQIYNWTVDPITRRKFTISATMTMAGGLTGRAPRNGGIILYFHGELSFEDANTLDYFSDRVFLWQDKQFSNSTASSGSQSQPTSSKSLGIIVPIITKNMSSTILLRAGISYISPQSAKQNLYHEQNSPSFLSFNDLVYNTVGTWQQYLGRATISADTSSYNEPAGVFYSLMYRSLMGPTTSSEYDGSYLGMDYEVHKIVVGKQQKFYSEMSIWDIYRTNAPLVSFIAPEMLRDMVTSMLQMVEQYKKPPYSSSCMLPKWPIANIEGGSMVGRHSAEIILDFYNKNISGFASSPVYSFKEAFDIVAECILQEVQPSMPAPGYYVVNDAGSTLEFAINAGSVFYTASRLGNFSLARTMEPYAKQSWRNIWEPTAKIPCPRTSASITNSSNFDCPTIFGSIVNWIPYPFETRYVEGSAVNYRWYVPQDLDGLFDFLAQNEKQQTNDKNSIAASYLEEFFQNTFKVQETLMKNTTLQNPYFDATNEPTEITPFIFCMMGPQYAHRTSYFLQKILPLYYFYGPAGAPGNTDYGGLTGFAVWAYIGLAPIIPSTNYTVFTPVFDRVTFSLAGNSFSALALTIVCNNRTTSADHNYVASFEVNGRTIVDRAWVSHEELLEGSSPGGVNNQRTAIITMTLSPVPVSTNSNIPPWNPSLPPSKKEDEKMMMMMMMKMFERLGGKK